MTTYTDPATGTTHQSITAVPAGITKTALQAWAAQVTA